MSKFLIIIGTIGIIATSYGCNVVKEKFFSGKNSSITTEDDESQDETQDQHNKLKGPIPVNPDHS